MYRQINTSMDKGSSICALLTKLHINDTFTKYVLNNLQAYIVDGGAAKEWSEQSPWLE